MKEPLQNESKERKRNTDYSYSGDLPLGLGMALTHNIPAMKVFAVLPDKERQEYIKKANAISSAEEMRTLVASLLE